MLKSILLTTVLGLVSHYSSGQEKTEWETWISYDGKISIKHPIKWIPFKLNSGEIISFISPKDNDSDSFPDGLTFRFNWNTQNINLDQLLERMRLNLSSKSFPGFENYKIIASSKLQSNKREYLKAVCESKKNNAIIIVYAFLVSNKIFLLTLSIEKRNYPRLCIREFKALMFLPDYIK